MSHLEFRNTRIADIDALFEVRANTRQNPLSRSELTQIGITPDSTATALESGAMIGSVCTCEGRVIGFCGGDPHTFLPTSLCAAQQHQIFPSPN